MRVPRMFNAGDLVLVPLRWDDEFVLLIERDIRSQDGWWWRVFVPSINKARIVGQWELEIIDGKIK